MDDNLEAATELETSPTHINGPGIGRCTLNHERRHPAIADMEQKKNLVMNLCQQPSGKDKLAETLKEEIRLLKAKLKGFEALAYLYQQSKNECASLKRLCTELSYEKEEYRKKCSLSDNELHNTPISPHNIERNKNIFAATDPVGIFHEEKKLNLEAVGDKTENLHDHGFAGVVQNKTFRLLSENEYCGKPEEPVELKSGEYGQVVTVGNKVYDDEIQSSFSFLEIQSALASSGDRFGNSNRENTPDLEISSDISGNNHESFCSRELSAFHRHLTNPKVSKESKNFLMELMSVSVKFIGLDEIDEQNRVKGTLLSKSNRQHLMESSATQTSAEAPTVGFIPGRSNDHEVAPKVDQLTCSSSSSEQNKSLIVSHDLIIEVQILRQQVMTFKDDFERERRDREKVRSEYDLLKWHFERVSADFRHLKDQLCSTEIKLEESEREKAALRHNITKTVNELRKLKKDSSSTSPRMELVPQQVPPSDVRQTWPCIHCTYLNPYQRQTCEMCGKTAVHRHPRPLRLQ